MRESRRRAVPLTSHERHSLRFVSHESSLPPCRRSSTDGCSRYGLRPFRAARRQRGVPARDPSARGGHRRDVPELVLHDHVPGPSGTRDRASRSVRRLRRRARTARAQSPQSPRGEGRLCAPRDLRSSAGERHRPHADRGAHRGQRPRCPIGRVLDPRDDTAHRRVALRAPPSGRPEDPLAAGAALGRHRGRSRRSARHLPSARSTRLECRGSRIRRAVLLPLTGTNRDRGFHPS